jgi:hypothetical protein
MSDSDILTRMLQAVDALDWTTVRNAFADEVRLDYTSLSGGEPETLPADDLMARWQGVFPGFDATQHVTGPVLLTDDGGDGVRADAHVRGYHHIAGANGGEIWGVHGHYIARLANGRITEFTLRVFYQEGNLDLPAIAAQRATTSPRRSTGLRSPV